MSNEEKRPISAANAAEDWTSDIQLGGGTRAGSSPRRWTTRILDMQETYDFIMRRAVELHADVVLTSGESFQYWFDREEVQHIIIVPQEAFIGTNLDQYEIEASEDTKIGILHELTHAWLSDKIHPLFGTFVVNITPLSKMTFTKSVLAVCQDWFVENDLFITASTARMKSWAQEFDEVVDNANNGLKANPVDYRHIFQVGLGIAISREIGYRGSVQLDNELIKRVASEFQATPPQPPSVSALIGLLTRIINIFYGCQITLNENLLNVSILGGEQ